MTTDTTSIKKRMLYQDLLPHMNYTLQAAARTTAGLGPFSDTIRATTDEEGDIYLNIIVLSPPFNKYS